ncbi:hypothetical protein T06_10251 [Trichinella sp. T6]|nr:hypothetical protein T06_10251 [Trichinella sp. T6]
MSKSLSYAKAQFALRHVSASLTKYYYVIASLPDSVASGVDDLLEPAGDAPYETLKRRLLERTNTYANIEEMANKADELIALSNNGFGSICTVKKENGDKAPTLEERIEDLEERF